MKILELICNAFGFVLGLIFAVLLLVFTISFIDSCQGNRPADLPYKQENVHRDAINYLRNH